MSGHQISALEAVRLELHLWGRQVGDPNPSCPVCSAEPSRVIRRQPGAMRLWPDAPTEWEFEGCGHVVTLDPAAPQEFARLYAAGHPAAEAYLALHQARRLVSW